MPKLSRLVAALLLALTAFLATEVLRSNLPESTPGKYLFQVNIALAMAIGWVFIGKRLGQSMRGSVGAGLTSAVILAFSSLLAFSIGRMWILSFRKTYRYPWDALQGMLKEFIDYSVFLQDIGLIFVLVVGSMVTGWIAELIDRRYP